MRNEPRIYVLMDGTHFGDPDVDDRIMLKYTVEEIGSDYVD
jgi:hypothetical protein